jgi:hypothetical protein
LQIEIKRLDYLAEKLSNKLVFDERTQSYDISKDIDSEDSDE